MGSDCDDVGALALLHAYADLDQADILACVYSSGKVPYGAGVIQAINHYYGRKEIPVGAYYQQDVNVMTGASLEQLSKSVIVREGYESWLVWYGNKTLSDQRPSWDLAAVYYAIKGEGAFLENSGRGSLDFDQEKGCLWNPGITTGSEQYYVIQKTGIVEDFGVYLNEMIAKDPVINEQLNDPQSTIQPFNHSIMRI